MPGPHGLSCLHILILAPFYHFNILGHNFQWRYPTGQFARPRDQGLDIVFDGRLTRAAVELDGCALWVKRQESQAALWPGSISGATLACASEGLLSAYAAHAPRPELRSQRPPRLLPGDPMFTMI